MKTKKKKLVMCIPQLYGGGAEQQITYLANEFSTDYKVQLVCISDKSGSKLNQNIEITTLKKLRGNPTSVQSIYKLYKIIRDSDCVLSASLYFDVLVGFCAIFTKINWWIRESNADISRRKTFKNFLRIMLAKLSSGVVANSKLGVSYWQPYHQQVSLVYNGYPSWVIKPTYNKKKNSRLAIIACRLQPHKNVIKAIEFFLKLKNAGKVDALEIYGSGPEEGKIRNFITDNLLQEFVTVKGFIPHSQIQHELSNAGKFISLSEYEGTPNVAIEALANGCEVYLSDTVSHKSFFPDQIVTYVDASNNYMEQSASPTDRLDFLEKLDIKTAKERYEIILFG